MRNLTTLGKLQKKLKKLERKFERIPKECVLDRERVLKSAASVERDINTLTRGYSHGLREHNSQAEVDSDKGDNGNSGKGATGDSGRGQE